jgi:peroxiredoxin
MKKLILLAPFILVLLFSCSRNSKIEIKGTITNADGKDLMFKELLVGGTLDIEKIKLEKEGTFKFKTQSDLPRFYYLVLSKDNFITLLINPGDKLTITADVSDLKNARIIGSKESQQIQMLNGRLENTKKILNELTKEYERHISTGAADTQLEKINQQYSQEVNNLRDSSIAFILKNLENLASIMVLYQKIDNDNFILYKNRDLQYIKLVSDALEKKYPDSPHVKALLADKENLLRRYDQMVVQKKMDNLIKTNKVSGLPEIALPNTSGDTVSFNTIKAKYKLLCFWATWSEESIQKNFELLPLYQKYNKKGFEIYMVSLDTKDDAWKKTIQFEQLPWINVIDQSGRTSYVAKIYNVRVLPTIYLINSNDDIVSVNPSMQEIANTLDYAFN